MCLSSVYKNEKTKENLLCSDVTTIEQSGGIITLTDLFGRRMEIEGALLHADLTGGTVVLRVGG